MLLTAFTIFHVLLSLVGIGTGMVVVYGLLTSKRFDSWAGLFIITTAATSLTGFLFPVHHLMPSHVIGLLSLAVLTIASLARYRYHQLGGWRRTYVITTVIALYLNVFVLVAQLFQKVPALKSLAAEPTGPPFQITQLGVLLLFAALGARAAMKVGHNVSRTA